MNQTPREIGTAAESRALAYLCEQGLRPIERNFRIRRGEIDLIMQDTNEVVFVEVRARANGHSFGDGVDSIGPGKRRRLIAAATAWLQRQSGEPPTRFDVLAVDETGTMTWLRDAFRADD